MQCEYGKADPADNHSACHAEARYELWYNISWELYEEDPRDPDVAGSYDYCCNKHLLAMDFIFDPIIGLPGMVFDLQTQNERPDLVRRIEMAYERWRLGKYGSE